eukprot:scaffold172782_cov18-Tisochrysis_lutea.AAC.1
MRAASDGGAALGAGRALVIWAHLRRDGGSRSRSGRASGERGGSSSRSGRARRAPASSRARGAHRKRAKSFPCFSEEIARARGARAPRRPRASSLRK